MTEPRRVKITGDLYHPRVPDGAIDVTRRTRWGNRHPIGKPCRRCAGAVHDRSEALALHRADVTGDPRQLDRARVELAGRDLACWCPPDDDCHADALLALANRRQP